MKCGGRYWNQTTPKYFVEANGTTVGTPTIWSVLQLVNSWNTNNLNRVGTPLIRTEGSPGLVTVGTPTIRTEGSPYPLI